MTPSSPATQQRCMWFPKSDSLGLTEQVIVGGSYRGPGRWGEETEAEEVERDQEAETEVRDGHWPGCLEAERQLPLCMSGTVVNGKADGEGRAVLHWCAGPKAWTRKTPAAGICGGTHTHPSQPRSSRLLPQSPHSFPTVPCL